MHVQILWPRRTLCLLTAVLIIAAVLPSALTIYPGGGSRELVVKLAPAISPDSRAIKILIRRAGGRIIAQNGRLNALLVGANYPDLVKARLSGSSDVLYIEENSEMRLIDPVHSEIWSPPRSMCFVPNDEFPNDEYYEDEQWNLPRIGMEEAWKITMGCESVIVAVVDTGIDYTHEDISANYLPIGYDWVQKDDDPMDQHGHGTHVAGIIAAEMNNGIGVASVAPKVSIMAERVINKYGFGTNFWIARGITHAADVGARVISMSLGGPDHSKIMADSISYANELGVLVIAASGNENGPVTYPASDPRVISVGATNSLGHRASYSCYGPEMEVCAPGGDDDNSNGELDEPGTDEGILSTWLGGYAWAAGTSMATPHVSGLAALIMTKNPEMGWLDIRNLLQQGVVDLGATGWDQQFGYGRIDAPFALKSSPRRLVIRAFADSHFYTPGEEIVGTVTATNDGPAMQFLFELYLRTPDGHERLLGEKTEHLEKGETVTWEGMRVVPQIPYGDYTFRVEGIAVKGRCLVAEDRVTVYVGQQDLVVQEEDQPGVPSGIARVLRRIMKRR